MSIQLLDRFRFRSTPEAADFPPLEAARADIDEEISQARAAVLEAADEAAAMDDLAERSRARAAHLLKGVPDTSTGKARAIGIFAVGTWAVKLGSDYLFLRALQFPSVVAMLLATVLLFVFAGFGNMAVGHTGMTPHLEGRSARQKAVSACILATLVVLGLYLAGVLGAARAEELFGEAIREQEGIVAALSSSGQDPISVAQAQAQLEGLTDQAEVVAAVSTLLFGLLVAAEIGLSGFGIDLLHHGAARRHLRAAERCEAQALQLRTEADREFTEVQTLMAEIARDHKIEMAEVDGIAEERTTALLRRVSVVSAAGAELPVARVIGGSILDEARSNPAAPRVPVPAQRPAPAAAIPEQPSVPRPEWASAPDQEWDGALA